MCAVCAVCAVCAMCVTADFGAPWVSLDRYELRPDARRFENWEFNYAAVLGLGAAVDYALAIGTYSISFAVASTLLMRRLSIGWN
jgi:selenocysteine lyase/cysteine desulfurase